MVHSKVLFSIWSSMYQTTYRRQPFCRPFSQQFLYVLVITSAAEKMASVLNQIVENEGTHGSLQGPFLYMEQYVLDNIQKTAFLQAFFLVVSQVLVITSAAEKVAAVLNQIVERRYIVLYNEHKKVCSRAFCLKKLNQPSIVFLRYFYIRRCSFSRAIFWNHKIYGEPPF